MRHRFAIPLAAGILASMLAACGGAAAPAASVAPSAPASASVSSSAAPASSSSAPASASASPASTAASASSSAQASGKAASGSVSVALDVFPTAYNISTGTGSNVLAVYWPAFDGLTWMDRGGKLMPALASSWDTTDAKTWTFHLRTDIKFQDGSPLQAQDVLGTFNWFRNPDNKAATITLFANVASIAAPDASTVVFTLKEPQPTFAKLIASALVVKGRALNANDPKALGDYMTNTPIGTGPYKFVKYQPKSVVEYQAMPPSFVSPRGPAPVQTLTLRDIAEPAAGVAALQSGDVQILDDATVDSVAQLKSAGLTVLQNKVNSDAFFPLDTEGGMTKDVRVRQALNYAVDKNTIINDLRGGSGAQDGQLLGSDALGYNSSVGPYSYDLNKAKQLLTEAGYPNGIDIGTISFLPFVVSSSAVQAIQSDFAKAGIKSNLQQVEVATWLKAYYAPTDQRKGLWGFAVNWEQTFEADSVYRWWSSDLTDTTGRRWHDQKFDGMYQQAKKTLDATARGKIYQQMAQYFHDQAPVIFLWENDTLSAINGQKVQWTPGYYADEFTSRLSLK